MQVPRDGRSVARVAQLRTGNLPVPVQTAARNVRLVELLRPAPGVPSEASLSAVLVRGMSDLENLDFNHSPLKIKFLTRCSRFGDDAPYFTGTKICLSRPLGRQDAAVSPCFC